MNYTIFKNVLNKFEIAEVMNYDYHNHHDDGDGHLSDTKKNFNPHIAFQIFTHVFENMHKGFRSVDPWSKLYCLDSNSKPVEPHKDRDYMTDDGLSALWSAIIYLTDEYTGGETVFNSIDVCPHLEAGSLLVFPHNILHEGRQVLTGKKIVLKTDLLFYDR